MKIIIVLIFCLPFYLSAQVQGVVLDKNSGETIIGAKVISSKGLRTLTNSLGKFYLEKVEFPDTLQVSFSGYKSQNVILTEPIQLEIKMLSEFLEIDQVVITAGRRKQALEDVTISMEILPPSLINNKALTNIEDAVDQSPGVYAMDGQVSIRGGSGFAYGAGSRVLVIMNGMPLLSGDAGDAKWNAVPMENISQIEILKGASSVLFGSGALNGIITLNEKEPSKDGELKVKLQSGIYDNPKRSSLKWWSKNPMYYQTDAYYGKSFRQFGYYVSANAYTNPGYREGESEDRVRLNGSAFYTPEKMNRLKIGLNYTIQIQETGNFIIWESDSLAYTPSGGADTSNSASTLTYNKGIRFNFDPYIKFTDKYENAHSLKTRYYYIKNENITNSEQSSSSYVRFADYQFQKKWSTIITLTSGITYIRSDVESYLFGNHFSNNASFYLQYEHRIKKLDLTGGLRTEYFDQDKKRGDSDYMFGNDSGRVLPVYPIFRFGAHYKLLKGTHLRASFGQGIRYPAIAERYTKTSVGSLNVFPNPELKPETGWAVEMGVKQIVRAGKNWKGMIDIAGFVNQYENMMEFTFDEFKPDSIPWSLNPESPGYINKWFGFQARNAEKARITGIETSFNSQGQIGEFTINSLLGYTYMNPVSLNTDTNYLKTFSDSNSTILKYRFRHLFKGDIEITWKGISVGYSVRYNSFMSNIDAIFESEILPGVSILPGLKEYRERHQTGSLVSDCRIGYTIKEVYRIGFIVNNIFNAEYMTRPGDIQAPRSFVLQLQFNFK